MALFQVFAFFVFFSVIVTIVISSGKEVRCPNDLFDQKISCRPGQAVSNVQWHEGVPNCKLIHVDCQNFTSSCLEVRKYVGNA